MEVDYDWVNKGATSSILKTSSSTHSSTSVTQIVFKCDEIGAGSGASGKLVKKLSKVKESS